MIVRTIYKIICYVSICISIIGLVALLKFFTNGDVVDGIIMGLLTYVIAKHITKKLGIYVGDES